MLKPLKLFCFSFHDTDSNIRVFRREWTVVKIQLIKQFFVNKFRTVGLLVFSSDDGWSFFGSWLVFFGSWLVFPDIEFLKVDLDFYLDIKVIPGLECIFSFRLTGYFLRRMALRARHMITGKT